MDDLRLPLWFFVLLSFFRRLISELTERISTKLGYNHSLTTAIWKIWSELLPDIFVDLF